MKYKIGDRFWCSSRFPCLTIIELVNNILYKCRYFSNEDEETILYVSMSQEELDNYKLLKPLLKTILPLP